MPRCAWCDGYFGNNAEFVLHLEMQMCRGPQGPSQDAQQWNPQWSQRPADMGYTANQQAPPPEVPYTPQQRAPEVTYPSNTQPSETVFHEARSTEVAFPGFMHRDTKHSLPESMYARWTESNTRWESERPQWEQPKARWEDNKPASPIFNPNEESNEAETATQRSTSEPNGASTYKMFPNMAETLNKVLLHGQQAEGLDPAEGVVEEEEEEEVEEDQEEPEEQGAASVKEEAYEMAAPEEVVEEVEEQEEEEEDPQENGEEQEEEEEEPQEQQENGDVSGDEGDAASMKSSASTVDYEVDDMAIKSEKDEEDDFDIDEEEDDDADSDYVEETSSSSRRRRSLRLPLMLNTNTPAKPREPVVTPPSTVTEDGLHKCGICQQTYTTPTTLRRHMRSHLDPLGNIITTVGGKRAYQCHLCDKEYAHAGFLKKHLLSHKATMDELAKAGTTDTIWPCDLCDKIYTRYDNLKKHRVTHTDKKRFHCRRCGKTFWQKGQMKKHSRENCSINVTSVTTRRTSTRKRIKKEETEDEDDELEEEEEDTKRKKPKLENDTDESDQDGDRDEDDLSQFIAYIDLDGTIVDTSEKPPPPKPDASGLFCCEECGKGFTSHHLLKRHMDVHGEKQHQCMLCHKFFRRKEHLKTHVGGRMCRSKDAPPKKKKNNSNDLPVFKESFKCIVCKDVFQEEEVFLTHKKTHDVEAYYSAQITLKEKAKLSVGVPLELRDKLSVNEMGVLVPDDVPEEEKQGLLPPKEFEILGGTATTPFDMVNMTLDGERIYECPHCDKVFEEQTSISKHYLASHAKRRRFCCPSCGREFGVKKSLIHHMRSNCPKKFRIPGKIDENSEEFDPGTSLMVKCELCGKIVSHRGALTMHKRKKHGIYGPPEKQTRPKKYTFVTDGPIVYPEDLENFRQQNEAVNGVKSEEGDVVKVEKKKCEDAISQEPFDPEKPHRCPVCTKGFPDEKEVDTHVKAFETPFTLGCRYCHQFFSCERTLQRHMEANNRKSIVECPVCGKGFTRNEHFMRHCESSRCVRSGKSVVCKLCEQVVPFEDYLRHTRQHAGISTYSCPYCFQMYVSIFAFERHRKKCEAFMKTLGYELKDEDGMPVKVTTDCQLKPVKDGEETTEEGPNKRPAGPQQKGLSNLRVYNESGEYGVGKNQEKEGEGQEGQKTPNGTAQEGEDKDKPTEKYGHHCPVEGCAAIFQRPHRLQTHIRLVHTTMMQVQCNICNRTLSNKHNLKIHMRIHNEEKAFKCNLCGRKFRMEQTLRDHIRRHTGERPYQCAICGSRYPTNKSLRVHVIRHGIKEKFTCSDCGKDFSSKKLLQYHVKVHKEPKKAEQVPCPMCGKTVANKTVLQMHLRTHTGERPYECKYCHKRFSWQSCHKKHELLHTGKAFQCPVCTKAFVMASDLNEHMRNHTGERPFPCTICDKAFTNRRCFNQHMRTHGEKKNLCSICGKAFSEVGYLNRHMKTHGDQYAPPSRWQSAGPRSKAGAGAEGPQKFPSTKAPIVPSEPWVKPQESLNMQPAHPPPPPPPPPVTTEVQTTVAQLPPDLRNPSPSMADPRSLIQNPPLDIRAVTHAVTHAVTQMQHDPQAHTLPASIQDLRNAGLQIPDHRATNPITDHRNRNHQIPDHRTVNPQIPDHRNPNPLIPDHRTPAHPLQDHHPTHPLQDLRTTIAHQLQDHRTAVAHQLQDHRTTNPQLQNPRIPSPQIQDPRIPSPLIPDPRNLNSPPPDHHSRAPQYLSRHMHGHHPDPLHTNPMSANMQYSISHHPISHYLNQHPFTHLNPQDLTSQHLSAQDLTAQHLRAPHLTAQDLTATHLAAQHPNPQ